MGIHARIMHSKLCVWVPVLRSLHSMVLQVLLSKHKSLGKCQKFVRNSHQSHTQTIAKCSLLEGNVVWKRKSQWDPWAWRYRLSNLYCCSRDKSSSIVTPIWKSIWGTVSEDLVKWQWWLRIFCRWSYVNLPNASAYFNANLDSPCLKLSHKARHLDAVTLQNEPMIKLRVQHRKPLSLYLPKTSTSTSH